MSLIELVDIEIDEKKPYRPSRALIAYSQHGAALLEIDGTHIELEVYESGLHSPEDLGIGPSENDEDGLWVWEGEFVYFQTGWECVEWDVEPNGKCRRPTPEEWALIMENKPLWPKESDK